MKIVLQRVKKAAVTIDGIEKSSIGPGFLVLAGIVENDNDETAIKMAKKVAGFRIMDDEQGKMNLDILRTGGSILSVSQFTLLADTEKGNRPGFSNAAKPVKAKNVLERFNTELRALGIDVQEGSFGDSMEVSLVNEGPATFILEL